VDDWDFLFNPQWVIDEAIFRVLAQSRGPTTVPVTIESPSSNDADSYPATPDDTDDFLPRYEFVNEHTAELQMALHRWAHENNLHQQEHLQFEDDMGAAPAYQALHVLHGSLNAFVDYPAMVAQGIQNFRAPPPFDSTGFSVASDDELDPGASPTSLDHSLPTSAVRSTLNEHETATEDFEIEQLHQGSANNKRKNPDGEEGGLFQNGRRKKLRKSLGDVLRQHTIKREALKAAGFSDTNVIRMMAGVRLGSIEAA
jgi:hypothetical protein